MITFTNISLTLAFAVIMAVGQIILNIASKQIFSLGHVSIGALISLKWLWIGITIYIVAFVIWLYILSRFDIRYAYPISSTAIVFVALIQSMIHRDYLPINYWLGLAFVIIGLSVLSFNNKIY